MKVKRYQADNMRQAMAQVREELGEDAVLISNKRVNGKVEVLAASGYELEQLQHKVNKATVSAPTEPSRPADTRPATRGSSERNLPFEMLADLEREKELSKQRDQKQQAEIHSQSQSLREMQEELGRLRKMFEGEMEQLMWRESRDRQPNRVALLSRLEMIGINHDLAVKLVEKVLPCDDLNLGWQRVIRTLLKALKKPAPDPLEDGGIIAMIGSTGVGKTTTAVKLAARYAEIHGRNQVALVTTDDFRPGQREQLLSLGGSLGLSVQVAASQQEMQQALDSYSERKLVIIDTAGVNQRRKDFEKQFATVLAGDRPVVPFLVLSATVQESVLNDTIRAFTRLEPAAAIITKTDENASIGAVLSALIRYRLPVSYVATGQGIPDDLKQAGNEFFTGKIKQSYRQAVAQMSRRRSATA